HLLEGPLAVGGQDGGVGRLGAVHEAVHGLVVVGVAELVGQGAAGVAAEPLGDAAEAAVAGPVAQVDGAEVVGDKARGGGPVPFGRGGGGHGAPPCVGASGSVPPSWPAVQAPRAASAAGVVKKGGRWPRKA